MQTTDGSVVARATACVIYAAKSTDDLRGSLAQQVGDCTAAIELRGKRYVAREYRDNAVSGYSSSRGPGLVRALGHAERLAADEGSAELWIQHSDRIARGDGKRARHVVEVALWALKHDVRVCSVEDPDTFRDLLYAVVVGQRNHMDSARKAAACSAGLRRAAERGEWPGGPVLDGYRITATIDHRGRVKKSLEIDPDRSPLFELIFRLAARGRSNGDIGREVTRRGWRTRARFDGDDPAYFSATRIWAILRNPRYAGLSKYKDDVLGPAQWEGYISPATYEQIQRRLRPRKRRPNRPGEPMLLRRLAVCGHCGAPMTAQVGPMRRDRTRTRTYICTARRAGACRSHGVNALVVDHALIAYLPIYTSEQTNAERPREQLSPTVYVDDVLLPTGRPELHLASQLRDRIRAALADGADELAEGLLDHLVQLRAQSSDGEGVPAARVFASEEVAEAAHDLLPRFYAWSAAELKKTTDQTRQECKRLNALLRSWFSHVVLTGRGGDIGIRPVLEDDSSLVPWWSEEAIAAGLPEVTVNISRWRGALHAAGLRRRRGETWSREDIIRALQAWARGAGRAPYRSEWCAATTEHPHVHTVQQRFGTWTNAIHAAGLKPAPHPRSLRGPDGRFLTIS